MPKTDKVPSEPGDSLSEQPGAAASVLNSERSEALPYDEELLYELADLFKVFSDTTRIKILYALMEQNLCVADIAVRAETSQSAVSHQLRVLRQARLVRAKRDGKSVIYSLTDDHVHTMLSQGLDHLCE